MRLRYLVPACALACGVLTAVALGAGMFNQVHPDTYDPAHTGLVSTGWVNGIGCPTGAVTATPNANYDGVAGTAPYTDPACPTGDPKDSNHGAGQKNEGLLMVKTGPSANFAASQVELKGAPKTVTELGYDLRKAAGVNSPNGSHCGAGAPRFDVTTTDGDWLIGCNSPAGTVASSSQAWLRLRWGNGTAGSVIGYDSAHGYAETPVTGTVKSIYIVYDEGQDTGPDYFGAAVLDNIDVNGTLIGQGPHGDLG